MLLCDFEPIGDVDGRPTYRCVRCGTAVSLPARSNGRVPRERRCGSIKAVGLGDLAEKVIGFGQRLLGGSSTKLCAPCQKRRRWMNRNLRVTR